MLTFQGEIRCFGRFPPHISQYLYFLNLPRIFTIKTSQTKNIS